MGQDTLVATHDRNDPASGGSAPENDPEFIRKCLEGLESSQAEFPIRVEGTQALPYSSQILAIEGTTGLILKLIRPMPHELMSGALFEMVFSAGEQRYQALITYRKREAYLTYRFSFPAALALSDRRKSKRYPFRPRESVDILAQDSSVPGHGMSGPLVNLSMGGLAFRVDRIVKLDDGMRVPITKAFFDRGKVFPRLEIRNLPKIPLLEVRGTVSHVEEVSDGVLLGLEFNDLNYEITTRLGMVLEIREKAFRSPVGTSPSEPRGGRARSGKEKEAAEPSEVPAAPADVPAPAFPALARLQRRCQDLYLIDGGHPDAGKVLAHLGSAGYIRIRAFRTPAELGQALPSGQEPGGALIMLLDPEREPLQEIRSVQACLGARQALPAIFLSATPDPMAGLAEEAGWRQLPMPENDEDSRLIDALDRLNRID